MIPVDVKTGKKIIKGAIREIGANLVAANLYPLGVFEKNKELKKHSNLAHNPLPVVLVHGIIHNRSAFISMQSKMERLGWENIFTINYKTYHGNTLHMTQELGERIQEVLKKTGASQVDVVAHSLGGIVARTCMSLGETRGKIRRLVTLGTAHQGTQLSFLARGLSRGALDHDLREKSYLLKLLEGTSLPKGSEVTSIYSHFDWTVWPYKNAETTGTPHWAFKNIQVNEYVGHTGLLYSDEVFDSIVKSILI